MNDRERQKLVEEIISALDEASAPEGIRLLELTRAEHELVDALTVIRREIDRIARSTARDVTP